MSNYFPQYTTDYISGVMSLRKPQTQSLKILEEIVSSVQLRKGMNLKAALGAVHCEVASRWGKANGYKEWRYLFIPSKQIMPNSSFMQLAKRFQEL